MAMTKLAEVLDRTVRETLRRENPVVSPMKFDGLGRELPDDTPVELPFGYKEPETMEQMVARLVRGSLSRAAAEDGMETFEEASDFEVEEPDAELFGTEYEEMAEDMGRVPQAVKPLVEDAVEKAAVDATEEEPPAESVPTAASSQKLK